MSDPIWMENESDEGEFELIQELEELTEAGAATESEWEAEDSVEGEWEEERRSFARRPAIGRGRAGPARPKVRPGRPRPPRPGFPKRPGSRLGARVGSRVGPRFGPRFGLGSGVGAQAASTQPCQCPSPCPEHGTEAARWLQSSLNRVMGLSLPVNGRIDEQTRDAIRSFQQDRGLPVDGIAGPEVERALIEARAGAPSGAAAEPTDAAAPEQEFEFELVLDDEVASEVSRSSREYIKWVQRSLNRIANARLDEDGIMGPLTRGAVQSFQRSKGLDVDGIVGPITEAALVRAGATNPPTGAPTTTPPPPATTLPIETPLPAQGVGYYSYTSADKRYAIAPTISAIESIARAWQQANPSGPRLGIGNISKRGGGHLDPHSTHREGLNVDIRPVRSDRRESSVTYRDSSYSRPLTQQLVDLIHGSSVLKVSSILFNDPNIRGVKPYKGHDDHLHVTFMKPTGAALPGPSTGSTLRDRIVQIALGERTRWRNGALKEWDDAATSILIDYWQTGLGMSRADAVRFADNLYHWSAAYICWVLRRAGVPNSAFAYSSYHSTYIAAAYRAQQQQANGTKAYSRTQAAPRVGDLICTTYQNDSGTRPPSDLPLVRENTQGYHCDIVVASTAGRLTVVGGNVGDTVGQKTISIDSRGYITDPNYFAILRVE